MPIALHIHCLDRHGEACAAGHFGGSPSPGACSVCPHRRRPADVAADAPAVVWGEGEVSRYARLWALLHTTALAFDGDRGPFLAALDHVYRALSCGDCLEDFRADVIVDPPDFTSREALFACTHRWHDRINIRIGKPSMTLAEAVVRWIAGAAQAAAG